MEGRDSEGLGERDGKGRIKSDEEGREEIQRVGKKGTVREGLRVMREGGKGFRGWRRKGR